MTDLDNAGASTVMRTPRSLDIEITSKCNLRCRYCYFFDNSHVPYEDLPTQEWLQFFDELGACSVMRVTLQGGEPFLRPDLRELISGIVANRMRFSILSNGTLIESAIASFIAGTGRCDMVQVSIDGSQPATHDAGRGAGAFDKAVKGLKALQQAGVRVGARVTITRHNVEDLENTARFLLEELEVPNFGTNAAGYLGTCRQHASDTMLGTPERERAMAVLADLSEAYPGRIVATAGPLAETRMWSRMEQARKAGEPPFHDGGHLTGCGCHFTSLAVRADGTLVPCVLLAHMELGRINKDSLRDVWQNSPALRQLRDRPSIPLADFEFCDGCPYTPYCTGNCPALSYTVLGKVQHPSPDGCLRSFQAAGGRLAEAS